MTKFEQLARAVCHASNDICCDTPMLRRTECDAASDYGPQVRAFLTVLRDPTPEILAAAWRVIDERRIASLGPGPAFKEVWQAQIDQILSEAP